MNKRTYARALCVSLIATLALFATGCSDDDSKNIPFANTNNNNTATHISAGRYLGNVNITGQLGTLDVTVASGGAVTGTFTVAAPTNQARTVSVIPVGTYNVTGSVNLTSGSFTLTGTIPTLGNFSFSGTLSGNSTPGNFTITIDGSTYTGSISATSTNNGGTQNGTSHFVTSGTLSSFVFNPDGSYNGVNPPVDGNSLVGGTVVTGSTNNNQVTLGVSFTQIVGTTVHVRTLAVGILTHGNALVVGQSYPIVVTQGADGSAVSLSETTGTNIDKAWTVTSSTTGSATITSLTSNSVGLDFTFTNVGPNTAAQTSTATGTFSTSGHIDGNF